LTTRAWWLGVGLVTVAILLHASLPRYDWHSISGRPDLMIRVDRWMGRAQWGVMNPETGDWHPLHRAISTASRANAPDPTAKLPTNADVDKLLADIDRAIGK